MNLQNRIKKFIFGSALVLALIPGKIESDDIYKGVRGPTNWQADLRVGYTEREDQKGNFTKTFSNNEVLKYWNGEDIGIFGFVNVPAYKSIETNNSKSEGFGDLTIGLGPRAKFDSEKLGSIHFISYAGVSLPTGDEKKTPPLGNDRIDFRSGIFATYLTPDKGIETDFSFEHSLAGTNSKGVRGLDEMSTGLIVGTKLTDNNLFRIGLGLTSRLRENAESKFDYSYGSRAVLRVTPPKTNWHVELIGDYDLESKNLPEGFGASLQLRINF